MLAAMLGFLNAGCRGEQPVVTAAPGDFMSQQREAMVREDVEGRGVRDPAVLAAMRRVPRHLFVPDRMVSMAYADTPLPIGQEQTISQPYIVGAMTELARVSASSIVLEIGTGSGYQAAVLAEIAQQVYTIEIIPELGRSAAERLLSMNYSNVQVRVGDGYLGWPEHAPFDAIIVTAGAEHIPQPLVDQLKAGGRMVIPVGESGNVQSLLVLEKKDDGGIATNDVMPVRFVPLTGDRARGAKP
jgi:protein-L-isoaspartate(D-aspartate) O-methyltransferase